MKKTFFLFFGILSLAVCAEARESYEAQPGLLYPGGLVLFMNSQAPMSYESYARNDLPKDAVLKGDVRGEGCQYGLSLPLLLVGGVKSGSVSGATGNGGYKKALLKIRSEHPDLRGLYDVKVDLHATIVLGIFTRFCTEINSRSFQ